MTWAEGDIRWSVAHAYTPNEQATYGGGDHLLLQQPLVMGRLRREAGDALCKPARRFNHLMEVSPRSSPLPNCKHCLRLAPRAGIDIEKSPDVISFRKAERQRLFATRRELLDVLKAFAAAPEAQRERVYVEVLARAARSAPCSFGEAYELRGMIDPALFRRTGYRPCGAPAVAMERRMHTRVHWLPRCHAHVDRAPGQRLGDVLAALPPETQVRCWPYAASSAEILLEALEQDQLDDLVWEERGRGEWTYGDVEGHFVMEILG
jgi:hypothetical protein